MNVPKELESAFLHFFARKYPRFPSPQQFEKRSDWIEQVKDRWGIDIEYLMKLLGQCYRSGETLKENPAYFKARDLSIAFTLKTHVDDPTLAFLEGDRMNEAVYNSCTEALEEMQRRKAREEKSYETVLRANAIGSSTPFIKIQEVSSMEGLNWHEIYFVLSTTALRVKAREFDKKFHFAALGFQDNRKGDTHNSEWILLGCLARGKGRIGRKNDLPHGIEKNLPKWISKLRKRLRDLTQIDIDPLIHKDGSYQALFHIVLNTAIDALETEDTDEISESYRSDATSYTKHLKNPLYVPDKDNDE